MELEGLQSQLQASLGASYTIERELGGGGMSRVFVAVEHTLARKLVIKVLAPKMSAAVSHERFRREILLAARLQHPSIVPLIAAGDADGLPYFTMPFVDGESLRARLVRTGPLPAAEVARIMRDVASALAYAHERGVVHRDIKPDNILLTKHHALVADFGVAKAIAASTTTPEASGLAGITSMGVALGTPAYMAPEQALADPAIDYRADLYALGVTAYEMLTGNTPFAGRSAQAMVAAHAIELPVSVRDRCPGTPPVLAGLVMRCLDKEPVKRPGSADEVVHAIDAMSTPAPGTVRPAAAPGAPVSVSIRSAWRVIAAAIAITLVGVVAVRSRRHSEAMARDAATTPSIAVLPFTNVGHDTAAEYFADGMADELATALVRIPGLRVAARSSAFTFRGDTVNVHDVGTKLHVGEVLEGSVRRAAGRLRVTVQLVNTGDGLAIWSDAYERQEADIFQVEDALARDIAAALHTRLMGIPADTTPPALGPHGTTDLTAYDLFLQGRYFFTKGDAPSLWHAVALYQQACARDSTFARAHAALAMSYLLLPRYGGARADSVMPLAEREATQALASDPGLADAHFALGEVRIQQWRWADADAELNRSVALDPSNPLVHPWHADLFIALGEADEAVNHAMMAYDIDPLTPMTSQILSSALVDAGRYGDAAGIARHGLALDSTLAGLHATLIEAELFGGHPDSALLAAEHALHTAPRGMGIRSAATWAEVAEGRRAVGDSLLAAMRPDVRSGAVSSLDFADAQLALGHRDSALAWVARGVERHAAEPMWTGLACDPTFDALKHDPRFVALMRPTGMRLCPVKTPEARR